MPESIKSIKPGIWIGALLWTVAGAFLPFLSAWVFWKAGMTKQPDWGTLWYASAPNAVLLALAYWQKFKAAISLPEWAKEIVELSSQVKVTETTQKITQAGAEPITIKTVAETHSEPTGGPQ